MSYLRAEHRAMVDSIKLVQKATAFVKFASLAGAERFVEDNYPSILMPALYAQSEPKRVRIDFAAPLARDTVTDVRQKNGQVPHDGMRDVGTPANGNRVLLLRQVDPSATLEMVSERIAQEIARLVGRPGETTQSCEAIERIVAISDKAEGWSWGIYFVELATADLAIALLQYLNSPVTQPSGFRIANVPVAVSFGSQASFVAVEAGLLGGDHLVSASGGNGWVAYWHPQGSAAQITGGRPYPAQMSYAARAFLGPLGVQQVVPPPAAPVKVKRRKEEDVMVPLVVKTVPENQVELDQDTVLRSRSEYFA
jgi:RNA-binding protein 5/10